MAVTGLLVALPGSNTIRGHSKSSQRKITGLNITLGLKQYDATLSCRLQAFPWRVGFTRFGFGGTMKIKQAALILAALGVVRVPSWGPSTSTAAPGGGASDKSDFAPLAQWKAAVAGGDKAG